MAGRTQQQVAIEIREAVRRVQVEMEFVQGHEAIHDGLYSKAFHDELKSFLGALGLTRDLAAMELDGPPVMSGVVESISYADSYWLRVAWAWWCVRRHETVPEAAYRLVDEANKLIYEAGDQPLRPRDSEVFIGDRRSYTSPSIWIPVAIAGVIAAGLGTYFYRRYRKNRALPAGGK